MARETKPASTTPLEDRAAELTAEADRLTARREAAEDERRRAMSKLDALHIAVAGGDEGAFAAIAETKEVIARYDAQLSGLDLLIPTAKQAARRAALEAANVRVAQAQAAVTRVWGEWAAVRDEHQQRIAQADLALRDAMNARKAAE